MLLSSKGILMSVLASGACASLASTFAKLAFGETLPGLIKQESVAVDYALRAICLGLLVGANTLMLHFYVKVSASLHEQFVPCSFLHCSSLHGNRRSTHLLQR